VRIVDGMIETINSSWYATARQAGVSERDCELIRGAFVYEGSGYDSPTRISRPTVPRNCHMRACECSLGDGVYSLWNVTISACTPTSRSPSNSPARRQ